MHTSNRILLNERKMPHKHTHTHHKHTHTHTHTQREKERERERNCKNKLSHPTLSHIDQEFQESLMQGKIHIQQISNEDF